MSLPISTTEYCTLAEARSIGAQGDDATVHGLIADASRLVDAYCWTTFDPAPTQAITGLGISTVSGVTTVTATVVSTANMAVGQPVLVAGIAGFSANAPNGAYVVAGIIDATHFTYVIPSAPTGAYSAPTGSVTTQQTVTVSDIRRPIVKLPTPFSSITSVTLNGGSIDPSTYIVEDWGIRLYSISPMNNGWPIRGSGDLGSWPSVAGGGPYGSQVTVTATFGYGTIPRTVAMATKFLCRRLATLDSYERGQTRLMVGSYDVQFNPKDPHPLDSTGDATADQLLQPWKRSAVLVA